MNIRDLDQASLSALDQNLQQQTDNTLQVSSLSFHNHKKSSACTIFFIVLNTVISTALFHLFISQIINLFLNLLQTTTLACNLACVNTALSLQTFFHEYSLLVPW